jgi:carbon storage regulator CsrA
MLILKQRLWDRVIITCPDSTQITVILTRIEGNQVAVGYDAPREVTVDREKVHKRKIAEAKGELAL